MKLTIRWQLVLALLCVALVFALLTYQTQTVGTCTTRVPAPGGSFTEGIVGQPRYLNPLLADGNPVDREVVDLLFDGLVRARPDGSYAPALADSWEFSEDMTEVRFTLNPNARFHDGRDVSASDVAFSYRLLQHESYPGPAAVREFWSTIEIVTEGEDEVVFRLAQPLSPFLASVTRGIVPEHSFADLSPAQVWQSEFNSSPIGTGPFQVATGNDWKETGVLRLAPNRRFWRDGSNIDAIEFRFYASDDALNSAFAVGEVQAVNSLGNVNTLAEVSQQGMSLYTRPIPRSIQLIFNVGDESRPTSSEDFRHALAMAVDRQAVIDDAMGGQGIPFDGPFLPESWASEAVDQQLVYEADVSGALLDASGWHLDPGTGLRGREGERLEVSLLVVADSRALATAESILGQWREVGVRATIHVANYDQMVEALQSGEFDAAIVEIAPGVDPDPYGFWSQEAILSGQNYSGWSNRKASEALEEARRTVEQQDRLDLYRQFAAEFAQDMPAFPIFQLVATYGIETGIGNAVVGPATTSRERFASFGDWSLLYRDVAISCPES